MKHFLEILKIVAQAVVAALTALGVASCCGGQTIAESFEKLCTL